MDMERKDQMPSEGCSLCGAYDGEQQSVLRKKLVWNGSSWICRPCNVQEGHIEPGDVEAACTDLIERLETLEDDYNRYKGQEDFLCEIRNETVAELQKRAVKAA